MLKEIGKTFGAITSGVVLLATMSACSAKSGTAASNQVHDTAIVSYNNVISTLDPVGITYQEVDLVDEALYDALVTYNAHGQIVGSLAKSATLSDHATAVDITLRSGVKFHDGNVLTAQDVAYTLNRDTKLNTGVDQYLAGYSSTQILSNNRLIIHLNKSNSLLLGGLSQIFIVDAKLVQQHAGKDEGQSWLANHDAGSGPFQLASGANPQSGTITVNRYGGYWAFNAGRPKSVVYRLFTSSASERDALKSGELDLAADLSPADAKALAGTTGISTITPVAAQEYVYFNMVSGPTANIYVRRAVQLAYDYKGAVSKIYDGAAVVANGPLPLHMPCRPNLPAYAQNLAASRAMLGKSGYHNLTLTLSYQTAFPLQVAEATLLQSNLKEVGITLRLTPITFPAWLARLSHLSELPQMMLAGDFASYPNPGEMLVNYYMSTSIGSNRTGYHNPAVDALLRNALASSSSAAQCSDYEQAQKRIYDDATALNMYAIAAPEGYVTWLKGVHFATTNYGPWIPDLRV